MAQRAKRIFGNLVSAMTFSALLGNAALACAFHSYTPNPTLVDYLLASEHVVLLRADPQNARDFKPVRALVGAVDGVVIPQELIREIDQTRASQPGATVLFARDGAYGPWMQLAVMDQRFLATISTVLTQRDRWLMEGDAERYQLFADLLNDQNPDLSRLALQELDRADYGLLRALNLPRLRGLESKLAQRDDDLTPIRVLLAGLSGKRVLLGPMTGHMQQAAEADVAYLGAYAMAVIELGGRRGLDAVVAYTAQARNLPIATRERLVEALAIQGRSGAGRIRKETARAVIDLLDRSPELAGAVARQFGARADWRFAEALKDAHAKSPPRSIDDIFVVNQYITASSSAGYTSD